MTITAPAQIRALLPPPSTALIGREQELATLHDRLRHADVRLLTITGPGGVGKTRLALQVVADLQREFRDGIVVISLAPLSDPAWVLPTLASALALREEGGQSLLAQLQRHLQQKHQLLLLDNFEQVIDAAPLLADVVATCESLKLLITSRERLHLRNEHEFNLQPLPSAAACTLFLTHAQAIRPELDLTEAATEAIQQICLHLDGLPLAIELAAPRLKLLSPQEMLTRLHRGDELDIVAGGARDLPVRQRTLRDAMQWSYALLSQEEQRLFRRLGVFVGGFALAALEAMFSAQSLVTQLASLLDKNLIRSAPTGAEV